MKKLTPLALLTFIIITGCSGPEGPSGIDALGVDIVPPTVQLTEPWPLSTLYDKMIVAAAAVDNVAIERVVFTIDGSPYVPGLTLVSATAPYRFTVPLDRITPGWHIISARAYDLAGNVADAAPRPVRLGLSSSLSDSTVTLAYHNGIEAATFRAPDSTRSEAFWIRMTAAAKANLRSANVTLGGRFSDTTILRIGIWTGAIIPSSQKVAIELGAVTFAGTPTPQQFNFGEQDEVLAGEFYLVIDLPNRSVGDTLIVAADNGYPPWKRSGTRTDGGWGTIADRYSTGDNLLAAVTLHYPAIADTGEGGG